MKLIRPLSIALVFALSCLPAAAALSEEAPRKQEVSAGRLKQLARVAELLEPALETDKDNADLLSILGHVYQRMGRREDARRLFEAALKLNDDDHSARFMLALMYEKTKENDKAVEAWKKIVKTCPYPSMREIAERHLRLLK